MIDVHQHIWPQPFIDALRARDRAPRLEGWTLYLDGEPPYEVDPADHDAELRAELAASDGVDLALVSLSSPLGIEHLPADEAAPLLDAYHQGVRELPKPFGGWAAASVDRPDASELGRHLDAGLAGLQLPATALLDAAGYDRCAGLLEVLTRADKPLFIHPGPAAVADSNGGRRLDASDAVRRRTGAGGDSTADVPLWWPAMVSYVNQMHAAWYAFAAFGRPARPDLRICFAMLGGLAPLHAERAAARGGPVAGSDGGIYVDTSSYGREAIGPVTRVLGENAIVLGSDRPYASPARGLLPAIGAANPSRLLGL